MQYFVMMFSISASPISSDLAWYMGTVIGLSFLFIETKELCEARAKLETSSNFQICPGKTDDELPQFKTARALSELFAVRYRQ